MRIRDFFTIIVSFTLIAILLSVLGIISISFIDVLSYLLLIIGITIVYTESIRSNRLSVFLGAIIFMMGVYFLVSENFSLNTNEDMSVPLILILGGAGLLILHISTSTRKIFLFIALILITAGLTLFIVNGNWKISFFIKAIIPVFNLLWPVIIIIGVLILLLRNR